MLDPPSQSVIMKRGRALSKSKLQSSGKNLCDDVPLSCYGSNGWAGCSRCKSTGPCCCSPRAQLVRHLSSSISSESCVFSPCNHQGRRNPARRHTDSSGYLEGVRPLADLRSSIARLSDVQVDTPDSACDDYDGYLPRRRCKRGLSCPWLLGFHHRRSDGVSIANSHAILQFCRSFILM